MEVNMSEDRVGIVERRQRVYRRTKKVESFLPDYPLCTPRGGEAGREYLIAGRSLIQAAISRTENEIVDSWVKVQTAHRWGICPEWVRRGAEKRLKILKAL